MHRARLTRELARGADPWSSPERALRAAQLTSARRRQDLVRTLRRVVNEAHSRTVHPPQTVIINRTEVIEAEAAIAAMVERLTRAGAVCAEGMAAAEQVLTDGEHSPLYNLVEPGTLRRQIRVATEALDEPPAPELRVSAAA
jgi:hypothetical protein